MAKNGAVLVGGTGGISVCSGNGDLSFADRLSKPEFDSWRDCLFDNGSVSSSSKPHLISSPAHLLLRLEDMPSRTRFLERTGQGSGLTLLTALSLPPTTVGQASSGGTNVASNETVTKQ